MAELNPTAGNTATPVKMTPQEAKDAARAPRTSRQKIRGTAIADAANTILLTLEVPSGVEWALERFRVKTTSVNGTTCELFDSTDDDLHSVDFTAAGNNDVAEYSKPPYFEANGAIIVKWTGADVGSTGKFFGQILVTERD